MLKVWGVLTFDIQVGVEIRVGYIRSIKSKQDRMPGKRSYGDFIFKLNIVNDACDVRFLQSWLNAEIGKNSRNIIRGYVPPPALILLVTTPNVL